MGLLKTKDRESLAAEIFMKTGVPLSTEDPIFALVEILKANQVAQEASFDSLCASATNALKSASEDLIMRSEALKNLVDTYIEHRLEAANVSLEMETKRIHATFHDTLQKVQEDFRNQMSHEFQQLVGERYNNTDSKSDIVFQEHSWIDSLWTLTACLAIGFLLGFIYFNGTIRGPLLSHMELLANKLPSSTLTVKH